MKLDRQGSLLIVMPMLLVLTLLGSLMWNYQKLITGSASVLRSKSDMNVIASNVARRTISVLTAPGTQGGSNGCGSSVIQSGATSINAQLGAFRDFRSAGTPVTLTYDTSTSTGALAPSCLLMDTELPPNNYSLGTIQLTVTQLESPDVLSLSRKILVQVIANSSAQSAQNGQQKSVAITRIVTLKAATLGDYGVVIKDNASAAPVFNIGVNSNLRIMSPVYDATASGATVPDGNLFGARSAYLIVEAPFDMRGTGMSGGSNYLLNALLSILRGGWRVNVYNNSVTSRLPIEDPGPAGNKAAGVNAWDWPVVYTLPVANGLIVPAADLTAGANPSKNIANAISGTTSPGTSIKTVPSGANPWIVNLNMTCDSTRPMPQWVFQEMSQAVTINMDSGANNYLCGLIAAQSVTFNLGNANTNYYFFGQLITSQISVTGTAGGTLFLINPLNAPSNAPIPAALKLADLASQLKDHVNGPGRNFFVPILRFTPALTARMSRFRPNGPLSILMHNGVTASAAGYRLVNPGMVYPCLSTTSQIPTKCPGSWWPYDNSTQIPMSVGELLGDLFGTAAIYPDTVVFTTTGAD